MIRYLKLFILLEIKTTNMKTYQIMMIDMKQIL